MTFIVNLESVEAHIYISSQAASLVVGGGLSTAIRLAQQMRCTNNVPKHNFEF